MGNKDEKNAIREWIETIKYKKRMTQQDIAKELGVSKTHLSAINLENQGFAQNVHENVHETSEF